MQRDWISTRSSGKESKMPAIPVIAAVASVAVGVAGVAMQAKAVSANKKAAQRAAKANAEAAAAQEKAIKQQTKDAKAATKAAAIADQEARDLEAARLEGGAKVKLGAAKPGTAPVRKGKVSQGSGRSGVISNVVGGLASDRLGL
jgi:hypothetical protein